MLEEKSVVAPLNKENLESKKPPRKDDELWKGILNDVFEDFLRFFFPDADKLFDFKCTNHRICCFNR